MKVSTCNIILLNNIDACTDISILLTYGLIYTLLALCVSHVHWFFVPTLMLQMNERCEIVECQNNHLCYASFLINCTFHGLLGLKLVYKASQDYLLDNAYIVIVFLSHAHQFIN